MQRYFLKLLPALALGAAICMTNPGPATGGSVPHLACSISVSQDFAGPGRYLPALGGYWGSAPSPVLVSIVAPPRPGAGLETPGMQPLGSGSGEDGISPSFAQATAPHGETTSAFTPHSSLVLLLSIGLVGLACLRRRKTRAA
jgi:hypothetical protein